MRYAADVAPMRLAFRHDIKRKPRFFIDRWDFRWLIAKVTGAPVHVEILFGDDAYGADFDQGFRKVSWQKLEALGGTWEVMDCPASVLQAEDARELAEQMLGARYDYWGACVAWMTPWIAPNGDHAKYFCSEAGARLIRRAGLYLSRGRHAWYTPRRLRDDGRRYWNAPSRWVAPMERRRAA